MRRHEKGAKKKGRREEGSLKGDFSSVEKWTKVSRQEESVLPSDPSQKRLSQMKVTSFFQVLHDDEGDVSVARCSQAALLGRPWLRPTQTHNLSG